MRIVVGIHAAGGTEGLTETLDHLRRNTEEPIDLLMLADGCVTNTSGITVSRTDVAQGGASCFNRLIAQAADADLGVFLEAGALVGPAWLGRLLGALKADPRHGLAGPSTNRAWDLQGVFPQAREQDIEQTAAEAWKRYGTAWQGTEPLHSLGDFCYVVRRPVWEEIGPADEAYGLGPCWEMDYTIRAARAGFRAVWAQGAYVYRRPATARRSTHEAAWFERSRRLYQDRFCGLRLSGARKNYAAHCRGDACRHFAPPELLAQRRPATNAVPATSSGLPLVSCIMPTSSDRRDWMVQAIRYFQAQDYANRELVILDDGPADLGATLPTEPRIRYHRLPRRISIGAKRNRACELARGEIIAHWDDDDWYAPGRLSAQLTPLLRREADISGVTGTRFFDLDQWRFWTCSPELHRRLFVHDVHGGTLVYRRSVFERMARYPDASLAEDATFLRSAVARGARLAAVDAAELFLYVRHGANTWALVCGQSVDPRGWLPTTEPAALAPDRAFYAGRRGGLPEANGLPLVSCIMPTWNRRRFVPRAIAYFQRQDYENRELVIVDDGDDRVADLVPSDEPRMRYIALPQRQRLGAKRNTAIEASRGEIILHWDDDDWVAPDRIRLQVEAMINNEADISGCSTVWFCETATGRLSLYQYPPGERAWLYGATLAYRRSLWARKRFEPVDIGEDTRFVWSPPAGRMADLGRQRLIVAMVHGGNTSMPRPLIGPHWSAWRDGDAAQLLGEDWTFYQPARALAE